MKIRLGTRGSRLALAQTNYVMERLKKAYPQHTYEIIVIKTKGDRIIDKPLDKIGDKGLFVKEIEERILNGDIDLGVHSMKDMPAAPQSGLVFTKTWEREDPRDVLILKEAKTLWDLKENAIIATGSKRRISQLREHRRDLVFQGIRGNIDTRLHKLAKENLDGIVLAAAGLHRLGLKDKITQYLEPEEMVPAAAQGALALEIAENNLNLCHMLDGLSHLGSHIRTMAERTFLACVEGGCHIPVGAACLEAEGGYRFLAVLGEEEEVFHIELKGSDPEKLGREAAAELKKRCEKQ